MKIIIDIPEWKYKSICEGIEAYKRCGVVGIDTAIHEAIYHGTPLPKGYGRLVILSEDKLKETQIDLDFSCQKWTSEVGLSNATVAIIAADKAESEE